MEAFPAATYPNYRILSAALVDDSGGFAPTAAGKAYYDLLTVGDCTLDGGLSSKTALPQKAKPLTSLLVSGLLVKAEQGGSY